VNLATMLKDKRLLIGVGVAAAVGLVVLVRRKQTTGTSATTSGTSTTGTTGGAVGSVDTAATDIAGWMGDYSQSLQNQLDQYTKTLTDTLAGLKADTPSSNPATENPAPVTEINEPKYLGVRKGWTVNQWIRDLQSGNEGGIATDISWDKLLQLNPDIRKNITGQKGTNTELNYFMNPATYRVA
jgi:hypothetical protein